MIDKLPYISSLFSSSHDICQSSSNILAFPNWYRGLRCDNDSPALTEFADIWIILGNVIEIGLRVAALVAVGFIIYGGIRYIMSQGNPDALTAAKKTVTNAVIGLLLAILATTIVGFIAGGF
ncbi:MAG: pilin [Candidatus Saccharimonadales bacterium]